MESIIKLITVFIVASIGFSLIGAPEPENGSIAQLCSKYIEHRTNPTTKPSPLKSILSPGSFIDIKKYIPENIQSMQVHKFVNQKHIFLISAPELSDKEKPKYERAIKAIRKIEEQLKELDLPSLLSSYNDYDACYNELVSQTEFVKNYHSLSVKLALNIWAKERHDNLAINDFLKYKLSTFSKHWTIHPQTTIEQVSRVLRTKGTKNVVIIAHAFEGKGQIQDSNGSLFQQHFFSQISRDLDSLSIYSCYPKKVMSYYSLQEHQKNNSFLYFHPQTKNQSFDIYGERTPIISVKRLIRYAEKTSSTMLEKNKKNTCAVELNYEAHAQSRLGLYFNKNQYLGEINISKVNDRFIFNCSDFNQGTRFSIKYLDIKSPRIPIDAFKISSASILKDNIAKSIVFHPYEYEGEFHKLISNKNATLPGGKL